LLGSAAALATAALAAPVAMAGAPKTEVIASGLDNPRGLAVVHGDTVLVAEAGTGGDGPCIVAGEGPSCLGQSGAVSAIWPKHRGRGYKQERIVTGLPSLAPEGAAGGNATGPHDVALGKRGGLLVTIGLGASPPSRRDELGEGGALLGHLVNAKPFGRTRPVADLAAFEGENDPDQGLPGTAPDSNPYGLLADDDGIFATDAGGNDVLKIGRHGDIRPIAVFPPQFVEFPPGSGGQVPMQFVPTAVTRGPDDALYVGQLTGFPFPVGGAKVWRLERGEEPQAVAEGFTNVLDIAFDRRGRLYVLEMFKNGLLGAEQDPAGRLVRVERDGSHTEIPVEGLIAPSSVAIGKDGSIYVSNKGTAAGGGEVLRISRHR
jgi:hypothetical protein